MRFVALKSVGKRIVEGQTYEGTAVAIYSESRLPEIKILVHDGLKKWMTFDPRVFEPALGEQTLIPPIPAVEALIQKVCHTCTGLLEGARGKASLDTQTLINELEDLLNFIEEIQKGEMSNARRNGK